RIDDNTRPVTPTRPEGKPTSGAPVARWQSRLRATGRRALLIIAAPLLLIIFGCDRPPKDADRILDQLAAAKIYTDAPPGDAVLLAQGRDKGLASSAASRDPSLVRIHAVTQPVDAIVTYYEQTYPQYRWHADYYYPVAVTHGFNLVNTSGWMGVSIYIGAVP